MYIKICMKFKMNHHKARNILLGVIAIVLVASVRLSAQSVAYSQFHLSPMQTNPGMIASYNQPQAMMSYRRMNVGGGVGAAFETPMFSMTYPLITKTRGRMAGFGFSAVNDRLGSDGALQVTGLSLGAAYNHQIGRAQYISLGVQGGYFWQSINIDRLTTGSQWINGEFLNTATSNEVFDITAISYPTANVGLYWYFTDSDSTSNINAFLGISGQNLNQPNVSLSAKEERIPISLVFTGGITAYQNEKLKVMPSVRWIQQDGGNRQVNVGSMVWYKYDSGGGFIKPGNLGMGLWYELNGAAIVSVEVNQPKYTVAFSYDLSMDRQSKRLGAFELKVGFRIGKKEVKREPKAPVIKQDTIQPKDDKFIYTVVVTKRNRRIIKRDTIATTPIKKDNVPPKNLTTRDLEILKSTAYFYYTNDDINKATESLLNDVVVILKRHPDIRLELEGHTCNIGETEDANQELSERRANAVKKYLVGKGVDASRLKTIGYGSKRPVASNKTEFGKIRNRRVKFKLIKDEKKK